MLCGSQKKLLIDFEFDTSLWDFHRISPLGQDSPRFKPYNRNFQFKKIQVKSLLEDKTVKVKLGESQPWSFLSQINLPE